MSENSLGSWFQPQPTCQRIVQTHNLNPQRIHSPFGRRSKKTKGNNEQTDRQLQDCHRAGFSQSPLLSRVRLLATPWTPARQASLSITNSQNLLKFISIESVMPSNCLILCCPLLLPPLIFRSIRVFSSGSVLHIRWPKYWSFSFSISPSNGHPGLISFRMDWLDLLAVQGALKVSSNTTVQKH